MVVSASELAVNVNIVWVLVCTILVLLTQPGFAWMPVGLILLGASAFDIRVLPSAGLHALTVGAIGGMILAVMTRATRGRPYRAAAARRSRDHGDLSTGCAGERRCGSRRR
jgi:uncharacterized protein involved in response to NO